MSSCSVPAMDVFSLRCWARANLWSVCELDLHEAVDVLWHAAVDTGLVKKLGKDGVQVLLATAFEGVSDALA